MAYFYHYVFLALQLTTLGKSLFIIDNALHWHHFATQSCVTQKHLSTSEMRLVNYWSFSNWGNVIGNGYHLGNVIGWQCELINCTVHLTNWALCNGMEMFPNMRIISNCNYLYDDDDDDGRYKCDIGIKKGLVCFRWLLWRHGEPSEWFRHNPGWVQAMATTLWHHLARIPHWPILQRSTLYGFLRYVSQSLF